MPRKSRTYGDDIRRTILDRLAEGESLRTICKTEGMPNECTVRKWVRENQQPFTDEYQNARLVGYEKMADELIDIADEGTNDWMMKNDPNNEGWNINLEHIARSRLRIDTRKWILAKMLPKVYGDKQAVEHTGADGQPLFKVILGVDESKV